MAIIDLYLNNTNASCAAGVFCSGKGIGDTPKSLAVTDNHLELPTGFGSGQTFVSGSSADIGGKIYFNYEIPSSIVAGMEWDGVNDFTVKWKVGTGFGATNFTYQDCYICKVNGNTCTNISTIGSETGVANVVAHNDLVTVTITPSSFSCSGDDAIMIVWSVQHTSGAADSLGVASNVQGGGFPDYGDPPSDPYIKAPLMVSSGVTPSLSLLGVGI